MMGILFRMLVVAAVALSMGQAAWADKPRHEIALRYCAKDPACAAELAGLRDQDRPEHSYKEHKGRKHHAHRGREHREWDVFPEKLFRWSIFRAVGDWF